MPSNYSIVSIARRARYNSAKRPGRSEGICLERPELEFSVRLSLKKGSFMSKPRKALTARGIVGSARHAMLTKAWVRQLFAFYWGLCVGSEGTSDNFPFAVARRVYSSFFTPQHVSK